MNSRSRDAWRALWCVFVGGVVACGGGASDLGRTVVSRRGDTTVATTRGEIPDSALRRLEIDWRVGADTDDARVGFARIADLAVAPDGRVIVWDPETPALRLYQADGTLARVIGRRGGGPGEFGNLNGVAALPDGRIVVWDASNARFSVFSSDGDYQRSWRAPVTGFGTSGAVTVDTLSRIWSRGFVRSDDPSWGALGRTAWFVMDTTGAVRDTVLQPAQERGDPLLVARHEGSTVSMGVPYGRNQQIAVHPAGALVWGPSDPYRVHAQSAGRPLRIEREWTPVVIEAEERAARRTQIEWNMRQTDPAWRWSDVGIPDTKPAYAAIRAGLDGRIWVEISVASVRYQPDPPPATATNPPPPVPFRTAERRWDVFEPDGRYLGRVVVPRNVSIYAMRGNSLWGAMRDDDDVPSLVRMRVTPGF